MSFYSSKPFESNAKFMTKAMLDQIRLLFSKAVMASDPSIVPSRFNPGDNVSFWLFDRNEPIKVKAIIAGVGIGTSDSGKTVKAYAVYDVAVPVMCQDKEVYMVLQGMTIGIGKPEEEEPEYLHDTWPLEYLSFPESPYAGKKVKHLTRIK